MKREFTRSARCARIPLKAIGGSYILLRDVRGDFNFNWGHHTPAIIYLFIFFTNRTFDLSHLNISFYKLTKNVCTN